MCIAIPKRREGAGGGIAELTYSNLQPWALIDRKMLVMFGPAGSEGVVCIDGAPTVVSMPAGKTPEVEVLDEITLVVLNHDQLDAAYIADDKLFVTAWGGTGESWDFESLDAQRHSRLFIAGA